MDSSERSPSQPKRLSDDEKKTPEFGSQSETTRAKGAAPRIPFSRPNKFSFFGRLVSGSFLGFLDQAMISAATFAMMLLLARQLGPHSFGQFILAYTVLLFANSVQSAIFIRPHNVLGPQRQGADYDHYTTATILAQVAFSLCLALLIFSAGFAAEVEGYELAGVLRALAAASIWWQLQELMRRMLYTQASYMRACLITAITSGFQAIGLGTLWALHRLSAETALYSLAIAALAGSAVGVWQHRSNLTRKLDRAQLRRDLYDNWLFGRWLLGSSLMMWVSGQLYPILTAGFVGAAATGGLRAAQNLLAPTHVLLKAMDPVITPRGSRVYSRHGMTALIEFTRRIMLSGGIAMVGYAALISLLAKPLTILLLGEQYAEYAWLTWCFAVSYVLVYLTKVATIFLWSTGKSAATFYAYAISTPLVLTFGVFAVREFGLIGTAIGTIAHGVILSAVLWIQVFQSLRSSRQDTPGESAGLTAVEQPSPLVTRVP